MQETKTISFLRPAYWREAAASLHSTRNLAFAALMVAAAIILSYFSIPVPVNENLKITFGFLARSTCALVCGPLLGLIYGFVEDILGFILKPSGAFFPGYTLTTMLGMLIYSLCFYRARITVARVFTAKLLTNVMNVFLGSLWSAILYSSKGYWFYVAGSAWKNALMLIPQTIMLVVLFQALLPGLRRMGLIPNQLEGRMRLF